MTRGRPRIVCLSGSTAFKDQFLQAQQQESLAGRVVLAPGVFSKADGVELTDGERQGLCELHAHKIRLADELLVIDVDGYIGESTRQEIELASALGKPIRLWSSAERVGVPHLAE